MTARTLADPMFASIFNNAVVEPYDADAIKQALINHGEKIMNNEPTAIDCQTGEERTFTTLINPTPPVDSVSTTVQGVSGNTYAPMDTSPTPPSATPQTDEQLTRLFKQLQDTMTLIIQLSTARQQINQQTDLEEAVSTALECADWFRHRVEDATSEYIEKNHDIESLVNDRVDDSVGDKVDQYFSYEFSLDDHCDLNDIVGDVLDDRLDEMVREKVEEILEEKLKHATININF